MDKYNQPVGQAQQVNGEYKGTTGFALDGTVTSQKKLSQQELDSIKQSTGTLHTQYGKFVKVSSPNDIPTSETSKSVDNINENTKQIIDPKYK
ncbi:hypothetical protein [Paenibacillus sp. GbtcB18]|uniref:hypothetical protein n=1 Tax=Paenibacillus sp. GbtcB18 TaxID=2824763 RepID=UPI001C2FD051|nr:hypothetical protein [Paenibacillus sp. GbtcB18]